MEQICPSDLLTEPASPQEGTQPLSIHVLECNCLATARIHINQHLQRKPPLSLQFVFLQIQQ